MNKENKNINKIAIAIHGGAGTIDPGLMTADLQSRYEFALDEALTAGYKCLQAGASATEAVTEAVVVLEDCPLFNAGRGSVFNHAGRHEMDAAIMEGAGLYAGSVCGIYGIKNPVLAALAVMQQGKHVMISGEGAVAFAKEMQLQQADASYFFNEYRYQQWQDAIAQDIITLDHTDKKYGTVGAVAVDRHGNLAASTSTGGLTNKMYGRVGDTPIIGAGTYANNSFCAVSCTGVGEVFMRYLAAYEVACLIKYKGYAIDKAAHEVVHELLQNAGGEGGLIAIDKEGNIAMPFNTSGMYRGYIDINGKKSILIYK